jgi:hypothetical protein
MAHNNGFPKRIIHELKKKLTTKKARVTQIQVSQQQNNRWVTFMFHGPSVHKIINLFRKTGLKVAFRPTNTIFQQLTQKPKNNNPSGIYQLKCSSCSRAYVGQSGRAITVRHTEHLRYIRNNNPMSAYATYILHNRHEFGPAEETPKVLKPCNKGTKMNCWEALYMDMRYKEGLLIHEQQVTDTNPLFDLAIIPPDLQNIPLHSSSQSDATHIHTHNRVSPD